MSSNFEIVYYIKVKIVLLVQHRVSARFDFFYQQSNAIK